MVSAVPSRPRADYEPHPNGEGLLHYKYDHVMTATPVLNHSQTASVASSLWSELDSELAAMVSLWRDFGVKNHPTQGTNSRPLVGELIDKVRSSIRNIDLSDRPNSPSIRFAHRSEISIVLSDQPNS